MGPIERFIRYGINGFRKQPESSDVATEGNTVNDIRDQIYYELLQAMRDDKRYGKTMAQRERKAATLIKKVQKRLGE